ncbi:hypothetical protein BDB01DRAFT_798625 [Pilobolus umbonatus]|nr:hypothetical protein BDB01DRAFT_798625 [Pilobolus umbonatus]
MKQSILLLIACIIQLLVCCYGQPDPKLDKLVSLASSNKGMVKLNTNSFDRFIEGKRNYGMVVVLTALDPKFGCAPCREFDPEYRLLADSFQHSKDNRKLFFGHLDFQDGQAIFQKYNIQSAPNVFYYPPQQAGEKKQMIRYDLARNGFSAESLANFLSNTSGVSISVTRPYDYFKLAIKAALTLISVVILKVLYNYFNFIVFHKATWTIVSMVIILTMTSGYMWNRIRTPPHIMRDQKGQPNFIANGFSQQFGVEQQIVASIYAILSFSIVGLMKSATQFEDKSRQRISIYLWMTCILFTFSCLIALFRVKNGGYPFKILF